ncbi:unnamed protein product [Psylliodes chrysocephalus]|uniref:Homeobox domain-containing protein n=1 Tax=Psylliodes chrysocephalus TaxID=3402493 RepID=A0A9P0GFN2_9CUCU|nr:unnamed protein product [Psylliodes chrysocephala]
MTKVCRLCLMKLQRGSKYFNINAVESFTGFMPYRDQLTTCIPEMALDLIPNPVICNNCRTALKSSYDFKSRCLFVEKKIQNYIESQNYNENHQINYDLSQIPSDDVPPLNKLALLIPKNDASEQDEVSIHPEKFLKIQSDDPAQMSDSSKTEPDNSNSNTQANENEDDEEESTSSLMSINPVKKYHKPSRNYRGIYPRSRMSVSRLYTEDEFVCNFCTEPFRSLQLLRKHNNICSKSTQQEATKNILTKRPHLPTKAKNHLKKWLFKHTDHPYPTDQEKQMLMKETNLSLLQVENWFINARRRILQDLTKLKSRGFQTEDINDSPLGLEMDFEELVPPNSVRKASMLHADPLDSPVVTRNTYGKAKRIKPDPSESVAEPTEEVMLPGPPEDMLKEEEEDIEEELVDLAKVKCETVDNR